MNENLTWSDHKYTVINTINGDVDSIHKLNSDVLRVLYNIGLLIVPICSSLFHCRNV